MFVDYLFCDDVRRLPPSQDPEAGITRNPSWRDVECAIRALDGEKVRMVMISESEPTGESHFPFGGRGMMIGGGGNSGHYVCQVGGDEGDAVHCLTDPANRDLGWQMIIFGQPTHFDGEECVNLDTVIRAAREFAESGQLAGAVTWKKSTA